MRVAYSLLHGTAIIRSLFLSLMHKLQSVCINYPICRFLSAFCVGVTQCIVWPICRRHSVHFVANLQSSAYILSIQTFVCILCPFCRFQTAFCRQFVGFCPIFVHPGRGVGGKLVWHQTVERKVVGSFGNYPSLSNKQA